LPWFFWIPSIPIRLIVWVTNFPVELSCYLDIRLPGGQRGRHPLTQFTPLYKLSLSSLMFAEFGNIPDIPLITVSSFILNK
jgi:hypothetical protein